MSIPESLTEQEAAVVKAVRGLQFGSVEVVVHDGRIVEVQQKKKVRFQDTRPAKTPGGEATPV